MFNRQRDYLFNYLAKQFEPQTQITLNQMYYNYQNIEEDNWQREKAQLKEEIVNEVLSRLSLSTDIQESVKNIKELDNAINNLEKQK